MFRSGQYVKFKTADDTSSATETKPQDSGANGGLAAVVPTPDSSPASTLVQACAVSPAISMRMLPQVGEAIARHYSQHPQFVWSDQGNINAKAHAALASLATSDAVGLDPADYRVAVPDLQSADVSARPSALLRFEFALSAKVLTFVLDATRGRIDPNRLSGYHDLPRKSVDLVDALATIAQSSDITAYLESRNPDNFSFALLSRSSPSSAGKIRKARPRNCLSRSSSCAGSPANWVRATCS